MTAGTNVVMIEVTGGTTAGTDAATAD